MISQGVALVVTVAAVVSLALWLRLPQDAAPTQRANYSAGVVAAAFLVALLSPSPAGLGYKASLVFGLILTLLAVTLLQSRLLPDAAAHAHLLWAYIVYAYGFASLTVWAWPSPWLLVPVVIAAAIYWRIYAHLRELWETILLYALILVLATIQALIWVIQAPTVYAAWAGLAALLLIGAAHSAQAWVHFRAASPRLADAAFALLLVAQLPLAWSVWT